jgi:hypothetical protein
MPQDRPRVADTEKGRGPRVADDKMRASVEHRPGLEKLLASGEISQETSDKAKVQRARGLRPTR